MMLSPNYYAEEHRNDSFEELIEERENSNVQQSDEKPEKVEAFNFEKHYGEYSNLDYGI